MPDYVSNKTIEKLKYDLVRDNLISFEDLSAAEELSEKNKQSIAQVLIEEKFIDEETLLKFIQDNLHIPYVNLEDYSLDEKCLTFISAEDAKKHRVIPLFRIENVLTIAMADPLDLFVINNLIKCIKCEIEPIICSERQVLDKVEKYYSGQKPKTEPMPAAIADWREQLNIEIPDIGQAQKIVSSIVFQALQEAAFQVVFENTPEGINVKFRKPALIEEKGVIPFLISSLCVSRIKNISNLDSSVCDVPQLGKFNYSAGIYQATGIISTFPTTGGERITINLYKPPKTINELDLAKKHKDLLLVSLEKPGIILIAGPEFSGKSFIAYTILNSINSEIKNIMTVESMVKYDLQGINQCELNEKVGFNAEKALKFVDFQSPEVIYLEQIISGKLAEYALNLAKSGKLVITEINADDLQDLAGTLKPDEINDLERVLNCAITVNSLDDISVKNGIV